MSCIRTFCPCLVFLTHLHLSLTAPEEQSHPIMHLFPEDKGSVQPRLPNGNGSEHRFEPGSVCCWRTGSMVQVQLRDDSVQQTEEKRADLHELRSFTAQQADCSKLSSSEVQVKLHPHEPYLWPHIGLNQLGERDSFSFIKKQKGCQRPALFETSIKRDISRFCLQLRKQKKSLLLLFHLSWTSQEE